MPEDSLQIQAEWVVGESQVDGLRAELQAAEGNTGKQPEPYEVPTRLADLFGDQQFEPLMLVAAAMSLGFLIQRVARVWQDSKHPGGLIVDARKIPPQLIETKALTRGEVLVLWRDKTESYLDDRRDEALETIRNLPWGSGG